MSYDPRYAAGKRRRGVRVSRVQGPIPRPKVPKRGAHGGGVPRGSGPNEADTQRVLALLSDTPTRPQLQTALGLSSGAVSSHLRKLSQRDLARSSGGGWVSY